MRTRSMPTQPSWTGRSAWDIGTACARWIKCLARAARLGFAMLVAG